MTFIVEIPCMEGVGRTATTRPIFHLGAVVWYNQRRIGLDFSTDCPCRIDGKGMVR